MTTPLLLVLATFLSPVCAGLWVLAAFGAGKVRMWAGSAVTMTAGWVAVTVLLWGRSWWFVQEQVVVGLPLVFSAVVWATGSLARDLRTGRLPTLSSRIAMFGCAFAFAGVLLLSLVVGYPVGLVSGGIVVLLVLGAIAVSWLTLLERPRRQLVAVASIMALALVGSVGGAWLADRETGAAGGGHDRAGMTDMAAMSGAKDAGGSAASQRSVSVSDLRTPASTAGRRRHVDLLAQQQQLTLPSGKQVAAWTFGSLPGPAITATVGDIVEVTLRNKDLDSGVTVHWHGYDVPNGEDGVAGVTQDAVLPGGSFTYRFIARQAGTFWYHTHQDSLEGLRRGLFGSLVVDPVTGTPSDVDLVLPLHTFGATAVLGGGDGLTRKTVSPGRTVRLRLINTDQVPQVFAVTGTPFKVLALDGTDLNGPGTISGQALRIPAGGRADVGFTMPESPVRLSVESASALGVLLTTTGRQSDPGHFVPSQIFDPMTYGTPRIEPGMLGPYPATTTLVLDHQLRFFQGWPNIAHTINGEVYPHIPSITVTEGDIIKIRVVNRSFQTHPMHPHGHHILVLSVDGKPPTGGPVWLDTFDVQPGQVWEVALRADNPGLWMDHCHNLDHAARGMMMHLRYRGVTTPFEVGGTVGNDPE